MREAHSGLVSVLLVCVVLSSTVESAMECQIGVKDVFCAVSLSGTMRSTISVLLERPASVIFLIALALRSHLLDG